MTYLEFKKKWLGKGIDFDLFSSPKSGKMNTAMSRPVGKHKIIHSIVFMISIYMMNYIFRCKFSSEKFLKNKSISSTFPVGMSFSNHIFFLAFSRAVNKFSLFMTFIVLKFYSAIITTKNSLSRLVVT